MVLKLSSCLANPHYATDVKPAFTGWHIQPYAVSELHARRTQVRVGE